MTQSNAMGRWRICPGLIGVGKGNDMISNGRILGQKNRDVIDHHIIAATLERENQAIVEFGNFECPVH